MMEKGVDVADVALKHNRAEITEEGLVTSQGVVVVRQRRVDKGGG
jgi:hypothetical protein